MFDGAHYRYGSKTAHGAQRSGFHGFTQVLEDDVLGVAFLGVCGADDPVDHFHAADGADAAGSAFAAGFHGTELHGETGLFGHIDGIVKYYHPAMTQHTAGFGKFLVIQRRVHEGFREVGTQGPPTWMARTGLPVKVPPPKSSMS